ncbi:Pyruvate dehyrogenase phosphatase catalytic subunit [Allomyces javanicus]|nr:Pyruvate dehyrogenase phosphatase catalytic subunit [Allomyces javanicus]
MLTSEPGPTAASTLAEFPRSRPNVTVVWGSATPPPSTPSKISAPSRRGSGKWRSRLGRLVRCCVAGTSDHDLAAADSLASPPTSPLPGAAFGMGDGREIIYVRPGDPEPAQAKLADLTDEEIEQVLTMHAKSVEDVVPRVARVDVNHVAANRPIEDSHVVVVHDGMLMVGVFDGHGGHECAQVVRDFLPSYVAQELQKYRDADPAQRVDNVKAAMTVAFQRLDSELERLPYLVFPDLDNKDSFETAYSSAVIEKVLRPAIAGCVGSLALMDDDTLFIAHIGDSRALLVHATDSSPTHLAAEQLTPEHTCSNPAELAALRAAHPGEDDTVTRSSSISGGPRVLGGLVPTRVFGDCMLKWPASWSMRLYAHLLERAPTLPCDYLTPPYVHATPDVIVHRLDSADRMLVVSSDGLFDTVDVDEVGELLAMVDRVEDGASAAAGSRAASMATDPTVVPKTWIARDTNAATHLVRNALGGSDMEALRQSLSTPYPAARYRRDDMTCIVVHMAAAAAPATAPAPVDAPAPADPVVTAADFPAPSDVPVATPSPVLTRPTAATAAFPTASQVSLTTADSITSAPDADGSPVALAIALPPRRFGAPDPVGPRPGSAPPAPTILGVIDDRPLIVPYMMRDETGRPLSIIARTMPAVRRRGSARVAEVRARDPGRRASSCAPAVRSPLAAGRGGEGMANEEEEEEEDGEVETKGGEDAGDAAETTGASASTASNPAPSKLPPAVLVVDVTRSFYDEWSRTAALLLAARTET